MDVLTASFSKKTAEPLDRTAIEQRLRNCPRLPSLGSINSALRELLTADNRYASQISDVIRRDPSLTARLLRLVNSVYYGFNSRINTIEEAVFYLGVRQIRQLATVTPIIEDFQRIAGKTPFPWRLFWQHCISTAILTREILNSEKPANDEADYVAGLIHDVGKIAMAAVFPAHFNDIQQRLAAEPTDLLALEVEVLGMDHAELGGLYLEYHNLPDVLVAAARYHHRPEQAPQHSGLVAAVQLADRLARYSKIGHSGNPGAVSFQDWVDSSGWGILYPHREATELDHKRAVLKRNLEHLPMILEGIV